MSTRQRDEASARGAVVQPFLVIGAAAVALPLLVAAVAPGSLAGPLALGSAVLAFVVGFIWRPKGALLAFAIFLLFADTTRRYLPESFSYVDELSVPWFVVIALVRWRPLTRQRISIARDGAIALFFAAAIASSFLHAVPFGIWVPEFALVAKAIAFFYVVSWIDHRPEDIRAYGLVLAGVAVVVLGFAGLEYLAPSVIPALGLNPPFGPRAGLPSLKGPFIHPVHFSWFCAFVASLAYSRFAIVRDWPSMVLGLASTLAVILSARRWSLISLVAAIVGGVLLFRAAGRSWLEVLRTWAAPTVGTAILIAAFLPQMLGLAGLTFIEYVNPAVEGGADISESLLPRLALYAGSFRIASDEFPLGVGLGRYASWMSSVEYSPVYAQYGLDTVIGLTPERHPYITDTFWPQIIGESGVIGLVAYVTFLATIGVTLWRLIRSQLARAQLEPLLAAFALGAGVVFVQSCVESIATTMFHHPPEAFLTFGLFGVAVSLVWHRARATVGLAQEGRSAPTATITATARP